MLIAGVGVALGLWQAVQMIHTPGLWSLTHLARSTCRAHECV